MDGVFKAAYIPLFLVLWPDGFNRDTDPSRLTVLPLQLNGSASRPIEEAIFSRYVVRPR